MRSDADQSVGRRAGRCLRGAFGVLLAIGFFAVSAAAATTASATTDVTLWVSTEGTATMGCTGTGTSACATISDAITAAEQLTTDDVTIDVAAGTYDENLDIADSGNIGYTLAIEGAGSGSTIVDGTGSGTDLFVQNDTNIEVTISGIDFTGGTGYDSDIGGAVLNDAGLTLKDDEFSDDSASEGGAVYNEDGADVNLTDDTFSTVDGSSTVHASFGGAALYNLGTANLTGDSVSGVSGAEEGGVLYNTASGSATLNDDTFADDSAGYGGVVDNAGTVTLTNDTLSGDSASVDGGGIYNTYTATLLDDTLSNDTAPYGGGLLNYTEKSLTVTASILDSAPCTYASGTYPVVDGGYNAESDDSCAFDGSTTKVDDSTIDLASSLAANGSTGPETLALGSGSSAIDLVPAATCTVKTDERGDHRPGAFGQTACDAGAYEFQTSVPSAPQRVSAKRGDESITISWSAPSSDGGLAITGYRLFCGTSKSVSTKGTPTAKPHADSTSKKVGKLKNGTEYYCVVLATNAEGAGPKSSTVHSTPKA